MSDSLGKPASFAEVRDGIIGIAIVAAVGWFGWQYFMADNNDIPAQDAEMTIGTFKKMNEAQRSGYVLEAVASFAPAVPDQDAFVRCMGDYASRKSEELLVVEVLSWCERERTLNRTAFDSHYDELSAPDLGPEAQSLCYSLIEDQLVSPATADFPFLAQAIWPRGRQRYEVESYVDSQNGFGAMVRTEFSCDLQYSGTGDRNLLQSWKVHSVAVSP